MNGYKVVGDHVCTMTPGCLLEHGGGLAHRSCDCYTVEGMSESIKRLIASREDAYDTIKTLKAEIYDLKNEERY